MMTEEDVVVSSVVNKIYEAEDKKNKGTTINEDHESDEDLVDDEDSLCPRATAGEE